MSQPDEPRRASRFVSGYLEVQPPPEWNETGYDQTITTRYIYAFVRSDRSAVKVGMVGRAYRLDQRHREVARDCGDPDLWFAAAVPVPGFNHQTVEGIEGSMQTWLALAVGLPFGGLVDWHLIPAQHPARSYDEERWQGLLTRARDAVLAWHDDSAERLDPTDD